VLLLFHNPVYRPGLYGCAAILVGGIAYFALRRRYRLIASPEEIFALELDRKRARGADPAGAISRAGG
jgi:hypothetical protein